MGRELIFKNEEHKKYYEEFLVKAKVRSGGTERKALFYLFSILSETRNHINSLYDFKNNQINIEGLNAPWQTGGTTKITKLAFNLYNNWRGQGGDDYSPLELFSVSDDNREYLFEAIRIRFN